MAEFERNGCEIKIYRDPFSLARLPLYDTVYVEGLNLNRWRVWATADFADTCLREVTTRRVYLYWSYKGAPPTDDEVLEILRTELKVDLADYDEVSVLISYKGGFYGLLIQARTTYSPPICRRLELLCTA